MIRLRRIIGGLHGLIRKTRVEQDLDAELRDFLETAVEQKMRTGMTRETATRCARLELGSAEAVKDRVRDAGWESAIDSVWQDARYAVRSLRKAPGFAAVAVLTLGLGIGANTAIFSVIQALLLRPLPVPHADELVQLFLVRPEQRPANAFSYPFVKALAQRREIFAGVFGFAATTVSVDGPGGAEQADGAWVTGDYYDALSLIPIAGRLLTPDDDRPGAAPVVVITDAYWKRRYNGDPRAIGQRILIYGAPVTIVGVTGPRFTGTTVGQAADLTLPLGTAPQIRPELARMLVAGANALSVIARPRAGLSNAEVQDAARRRVAAGSRGRDAERGASRDRFMAARLDVVPGGTGWSGLRQMFGAPLLVLMALVGFVLLIACANVAILLLARTAARQREIATRLALGASRARITRQLLTESVLLALTGAALGLVLAWSGSHSLLTILSSSLAGGMGPSPGPGPAQSAIVLDIAPDAMVLLFTMVLAIGTVVLFGTAPALAATRRPPGLGHGVGTTVTPRGRTGTILVAAQLALTLLLLICSGLFAQTFRNLRDFDRGFNPEGVLLVELDGRTAGYSGPPLAALYRELHEATERLPGVRAASYSDRTPLGKGETSLDFLVNGVRVEEESLLHTIGPRYFETMRTPLVAGREFTPADTDAATKVAVVNEAFARQHLRGLNPLGQRLAIAGGAGPAMEIVGVVKDALFSGSVRYFVAPSSVYVAYDAKRPVQGDVRGLGLRLRPGGRGVPSARARPSPAQHAHRGADDGGAAESRAGGGTARGGRGRRLRPAGASPRRRRALRSARVQRGNADGRDRRAYCAGRDAVERAPAGIEGCRSIARGGRGGRAPAGLAGLELLQPHAVRPDADRSVNRRGGPRVPGDRGRGCRVRSGAPRDERGSARRASQRVGDHDDFPHASRRRPPRPVPQDTGGPRVG